jgi:pyruvate ferredoxin oxidoreductase gamma subunit
MGLGEYVERFRRERTLTVPATEIAREHLGRPMPNAVLLGGFTALCDVVSLEAVEKAIGDKFKGRVAELNVRAAREAAAYVRRERGELVGA